MADVWRVCEAIYYRPVYLPTYLPHKHKRRKPEICTFRDAASSKSKPAKLPTERTLKVDGGFKVTVAGRKGFDVAAWVEVLEDAARQARARLEPAEQDDQAAA